MRQCGAGWKIFSSRSSSAGEPSATNMSPSEMVVCGHSMGGLIGRLLTIDGGDDFWAVASKVPLNQLPVSEESREELRRMYYFQRDPGVTSISAVAVFTGRPRPRTSRRARWKRTASRPREIAT